MSEAMPQSIRTPEQTQEREEKRKKLREILPSDLQLEFIQKRPEKEKWQFKGELFKRRHSEIDEDKLFYEAIKAIDKKDTEEIKEIQEKSKEKRREIADNLNDYLDLKQAMQKCFDQGEPDLAGKIAVALNDLESARKAMQKCFDQGWPSSASEIAVALANNDPESARKAMQRCFDQGKPYSAGKIAVALNDLESARKAMQKCFDQGKPDLAGEIAVALNDLEPARKAMQKCFDQGKPDLAGEIAVALNDLEPARKAMKECFDQGDLYSAGKIALALNDLEPARKAMKECFDQGDLYSAGKIALALNDLESARKAMQRCFDQGKPNLAGEIAVALANNDPESARKAMQRCFDEGWPHSADEIAVALANNDPESARKAMQRCFDQGKPDLAGEIAVALNDLEPARKAMKECFDQGDLYSAGKIAVALNDLEPARKAMQRCFDQGWPDLAGKIAVALAKNFKFIPETKRLVKSIDKSETGFYGEKMVANLITGHQDLGLFKKEYLPNHLFLKKFAQEINERIEESKKWENYQEFFDKHDLDIANLHSLDLNLSTQLLKNYLLRGLSFAETYLDLFRPVLNNESVIQSIKEYLKTNKDLDGYNLSDLLEISSAYLTTKNEALLVQLLKTNKNRDFKELKSELNKNLLKKVAESLGIKSEIPEQELKNWKIKYFANLITNQEMIKKQGDKNDLELYNKLLKSIFENRFDDFISNLDQEDEFGREIARHNKEVEEEFKEKGIDWNNWLNFKEQVLMTIGTQKKQDREALFNQFELRFKEWQEKVSQFEPRLKSSLEKDLAKLTQKKKEFDPSKINLNQPNWLEELLPTYANSLNYLKSKDPNYKLPLEIEESFNHLVETIKTLSQEQKEQTTKKDFIVKLWDRDPKKDMFQGNQTHCCIAVGVKEAPPGGGMTTLHPETIFQYLIDKGINVAEIVDPDTDEVIAQVWLFVTLDKNRKPVLVADNFEVNNRYPAGNNVNRGIREAMFQFLQKYAKACNIEKVVLGKVFTNDVETGDLNTISLPEIKKLGGYFNDEKYYLETLGHQEAYEIK